MGHIHAFTTVFRSFLTCTAILPYSTDIPLASNICGLSFDPTSLTPDLVIFFTKYYSSILSTCANHRNTPCSARLTNSLTTLLLICSSSSLHLLIPCLIHTCDSTRTTNSCFPGYQISQLKSLPGLYLGFMGSLPYKYRNCNDQVWEMDTPWLRPKLSLPDNVKQYLYRNLKQINKKHKKYIHENIDEPMKYRKGLVQRLLFSFTFRVPVLLWLSVWAVPTSVQENEGWM